jgi:hypothetical protein
VLERGITPIRHQFLAHGWLRPAVQASVSDRVRSGYFTAMIWLIAPPIDAPTTWAVSAPASSSTAIASSAICSSVLAAGLSLRPAPRLSSAIAWYHGMVAQRWRSQPCLSAPRPWMNRIGGAPGRPVTR